MSEARATALEEFRSSADDVWRLLAVGAAVAFWGWLLLRLLADRLFPRLGIGPGAGESFFSPAPAESAAAWAEAAETEPDLLEVPLGWIATALEGLALAIDVSPVIAAGARITIVLTLVSVVLGFFIAVPLAVLRVYGGPFRWVALAYTELIRGTPLLAQLFVLYFGLPVAVWLNDVEYVGQGIVPDQAFWIAIVGFTINGSAYQAEYIRGALESVDEGQLIAARAVGLSKLEGIRHVVLPQTLRYAIPAWTNELVYLIKYSSLAAFITVPELYYRADRIASSTLDYTSIFALLGLVYLGLVLTATNLMGRLEERVAIPGLGQVEGRQQGGG